MKNLYSILFSFILLLPAFCNAQDVIVTSFEDYAVSSINGKDKWTVSKGNANVVENAAYSHTGTKGLKFLNTSALQADHIAYKSSETGISEDVYVDFWLKVNSIASSAFSVTGYDLKSGSRTFMLEFSADNKIKIYNGSSGSSTIKPTYAVGQWNRISFKINNSSGLYQFALNGSPFADALTFREIKGGATSFFYHSIRFIQSSGSCDVALDDIYISTTPISDINFSDVDPGDKEQYTITVNQPQNAVITLTPEPTDGKYIEGTKVTASIVVSDLCRYKFNKWTNDVSGTSSPVTFTVSKNMTIGAEILEIPTEGTVRSVKNYNELKAALGSMNPGDIIELADGEYSGNGLTVTQGGCSERPIIVRAKNVGQAKLAGKLSLTLKNISYVTFEGLNFDLEPVASIFKMEGCSYIRITKNEFRMKKLTDGQTSKWILIGDEWNNLVSTSHHNRIDHNLFDGKYDGGAWVVIDGAHGTKPGDISKYDVIEYNHFRNNTPRADNEKETIRIGVSDLTPCSAYCTVQYNLFENCDGDPEIVSVKSCDNIVRGNTFRGCLGTVCLRQGVRNTVDGNYFFGDGKMVDGNGCGGVRVYGLDHKVINNYFEGLTGEKWDAAITITNGNVLNTSSSWSEHFIPENVVFAHNTYVNNKSDIEIGFTNNDNYGRAPKNCLITNNIFIQNANPIVKSYSSTSLAGVSFVNNIMHATGTGSIGVTLTEAQAKQIDPQLVKSNCVADGLDCNYLLPYAVYKLSSTSPAIDAIASAKSDYGTTDFEGQPRVGAKDIGADEYSNAEVTIGVIGAEHVGVSAKEFEPEFVSSIGKDEVFRPVITCQTADKVLRLDFFVEKSSQTTVNLYNMNGIVLKTVHLDAYEGMNSVKISLQNYPDGIYLVNINNNTYKATQKFILK